MVKKHWWEEDEKQTDNKAGSQSNTQTENKHWWDSVETENERTGHWFDSDNLANAVGNDISNKITNWITSYNSYLTDHQKRFEGRTGTYEDAYVSDSADWANTASTRRNELITGYDDIIAYLDEYQDYFDKDWLNKVKVDLYGAKLNTDSIVRAANRDNDYWNSWGNTDNEYVTSILETLGGLPGLDYDRAGVVYSAYQREEGYKKKYAGKTYEELSQVLAGMEDGHEKTWLTNYASYVNTDELGKLDVSAAEAEIEALYDEIDRLEQYEDETYYALGEKYFYDSKEWHAAEAEVYKDYGGTHQGLIDHIEGLKKQIQQKQARIEDSKYIQGYNGYMANMDAEDFAANSEFVSTRTEVSIDDARWGLGGQYIDTSKLFGDHMYDYINGQEDARAVGMANDSTSGATFAGVDDSFLQTMTEDEVKVYNYIYKTQSPEAAAEFVKYISSDLKARDRIREQEMWAADAKESPFAASLFSVFMAPLKGASYVGQLADILDDGKIDNNAGYNRFSYIPSTIRSTVSSNWGKVGSFAYNTGMSMADFLYTTAISGGNQLLSLGIMGSGAAADATLAAKDRGLDDKQAFALGTIAGIAEVAMEKISLGAWLDGDMTEGALRYVLKNALSEAGEEAGTSAINLLADIMISGDKSEWKMAMQAYIDQGKSPEEAFGLVAGEQALQIGLDALGGFFSGGVIGGGSYAGSSAVAGINYGSTAKDTAKTQNLVSKGLELNPDSQYIQKMKTKLDKGKTLTGMQVRNILAANEVKITENDTEMIQNAAKKRLKDLGQTGDVQRIAELATKWATGQELTRSERSFLANSTYGSKVANELLPDNIESGEYATDWAEEIGTEIVNKKAYNKKAIELWEKVKEHINNDTSSYKSLEERVGEDEILSVSESGKATINESGKEIDLGKVEVVDFVKDKETGEVTDMVLEVDGEKVKASEIDYADGDQSYLYAAVQKIENITPGAATAFVRDYNPSSGLSISQYLNGIDEAYTYGYNGYSEEDMQAGNFAIDLTKEQAKGAYILGQNAIKNSVESDETAKKLMRTAAEAKVTAEQKAEQQKARIKSDDVEVYFQDGKKVVKFDEHTGKYDKKRKAAVNTAKFLSKLGIGGKYYFYESYVNADGERVYKDANGNEVEAPNGMYKDADGSIHIDLNAGDYGQGVALFTLGHELTHFIKAQSKKQFKILSDLVTEAFDNTDMSMHERVLAKQKFLQDIRGESVSYTEAHEEVVADAMSTMLSDGSFYEKLMEIKVKDKGLFNTIKRFFKKMIAKFTKVYEELTPDQRDAQDIRQMKDMFDKLQTAFVEGLVEASDNFHASMESVVEENAKPVEADEIITDGAVVTDGEGERFSIRSMKRDIADGKMFEDLKNVCGWTQTQVDTLKTQLKDLVEYMIPYRDILDMNEKYGRDGRRFSPYKPNSDPLYKISMDFSTLCSKRLLTQYVIEQLQLRENRPMSAEEQMAIRDMLNEYRNVEKGLQVACAMCYVEAARLKSPKQIQRWLNDPAPLLKDYFGKKNKEFNDSVKKAQADFKESKGYDRDAPKKDMKPADIKELNKIGPRMRSQYQLSAEEQAIVDRAKNLPNSTYLTAGNLADLSEAEPVIYDAYTAFVRTATRSKSLEQDEPYYYGDSTRDNGNGIVVTDSFIEAVNKENGMRFSSWSDWRIVHLLDYITAVIDNSVRGAAMHGYTKFGDEVRVLGKTGMMFNMSGVTGTQTGLNEDGSLNFSETESIDVNEAIQLREEFPDTAGLQCIGVSDAHIIALLKSDIIDYVIPYHVSGLNADLRRMAKIYGWDDYTGTQHASIDKSIKLENAVDKEHWHEEPVFSEFFVGYDTGMSGIDAMRASAEKYKQMCKDRGLKPKFEQFANEDNYWKLLIDRKMINQQTGNLIQQKAVTPTFDFNAIKGVVDKFVDNYDAGLEGRALNHIVENWDSIPQRIKELKKQGNTKAKKTKKAVDTLANQTVAAQPKDGVKRSERIVDQMKRSMDSIMAMESVATINNGNAVPFLGSRNENYTAGGKVFKAQGSLAVREGYGTVQLTVNGAKESVFHGNGPAKQATFPAIKAVIEQGIEVGRDYNHNGKGFDTVTFAAPIDFFGHKESLGVVVKEFNSAVGEKNFYIHEICDENGNYIQLDDGIVTVKEKVASATPNPKSAADATYEGNSPANTVTQPTPKVKEKSVSHSDRNKAPTFYSQMGKVVDGMKQEKFGASSVISMLRGRGVKAEEIRWSGIQAFLDGKKSVTKEELQEFIAGSMLQIEEETRSSADNAQKEFVQAWRDFIDQDLDESEILDGLNYVDSSLQYYLEELVENEDLDQDLADYILDLAKKAAENTGEPTKWDQYKLDGGENYRELVFKMPGSSYTNKAMQAHWGENAQGVLAHARIQDFEVDGKKMLFIEEIQSDWHNAGQKFGYGTGMTEAEKDAERVKIREEFMSSDVGKSIIKKVEQQRASDSLQQPFKDVNEVYDWIAFQPLNIGTDLMIEYPHWTTNERLNALMALDEKISKLNGVLTPDAPFKNNYHEYVLKRLLRMAAEEGYDSIGWTTADIQSKRWSDDYAEGYRIEYDQDIPKFLKKYGKQWGAEVGKTMIDTRGITEWERDMVAKGIIELVPHEDEVWSMPITDSMKKSVLTEGQAMYSERGEGASNRHLLANAFEGITNGSDEYKLIQKYKGYIAELNSLENKLSEFNRQIHEIRFGEGKYDAEKLKKLEDETKKIADAINKYDQYLLSLEASEPLRKVIERERKKEAQKTRDHVKEIQRNKKDRAEQTEYRHKIRRVIRDLDKLLNRGNKKLNVKEDMKGFVSKALELADYLFTDHISNDELIRRGIDAELIRGEREARLVKETEEILTKLYDQADSLTDEEFTKLDAKRKANEDKLKDLLTAQRNKRLNTPVYNLFNDLVTEYSSLKNSTQDAVKAAYNAEVERLLRTFLGDEDSDRAKVLKNMRVADMTTEELWKLYNAYTMVLTTVRDANKFHVKGMNESIEQVVTQIVMDFGSRKIPDKKLAIMAQKLSNKFGWNYEKLYYALDRIGSDAFTKLIMNLADSENTVMQDIMEAVAFRDEIVEDYGFNNWDVNKKIDKEFMDNTGKKFTMTLGQLMSLYAYSRRDGAWDHIEYGGFVFGEKALTDPKPADSYKLSKAQCEAITNTLTKEQKGYVEAMQKFLSETMGEKGNEVSMKLYGIKLFGEKNYFPIHIAGQYKAQAQESQAKAAEGFGNMSNAGFTHAQNPNAKAPFVLEGFNEVWSDHVNEMSRYHGTVPALEDLRRVMNRSSYSESTAESTSVKVVMENHFGEEAVKYFDNLYREANSGAITDKLQQKSKKLLSLFRKNSVAYSLSVLVQQPASMVRAYAMIDRKYFGFKGFGTLTSGIAKAVSNKWTKAHTNAYNEMLQYAPGVTMAKEIGGFDTATGGSIRSYLLDTKKSLKQKLKTENALGKAKAVLDVVDNNAIANLPNVADKIAWIEIWNACKRETVAKHKDLATNSEAFMQIVGERFTEVIRATQVYDSIFAKSPMLKSKNLAVQYLVSFMNEPNTIANMVESAVRSATRGDWKQGIRTGVVVIHSIIFTNVLKSIIYAMRDDDEDETYIEKYIEAVTGNMMDDFNAFNYIPVARDVWSIAQGYDVERADMAIVADALDALDQVFKNAAKDTEDMTEEELAEFDKKVTEANWKLVESVASFFGIPIKNVRREVVAVIDHAKIASANAGKTTKSSVWDTISEAVIDSIPFMSSKESKTEKIYDAIVSGDKVYLDRLKGTYKTEDAYNSAVRKALRENDSRIHAAAQARYDGNTEEYKRIFREIQNEGNFTFNEIMDAINSEVNAIKNNLEPDKASSEYSATDFVNAILVGDASTAGAMKDSIIAFKVSNGMTQKEAEESFASSVASSTRNAYDTGLLDEAGAKNMLMEYADKDEEEAASKVNYWSFMKKHPGYDLTESNVNDYQEFAEPAGISLDVFTQYVEGTKGLATKYDDWGDVELSVRDQVLEVIDSLPLTWQQKDALYLAHGYSENKIWDVPW